MELNRDNYFTRESNLVYMSTSQLKDFMKCEAKAMAKLKGLYLEGSSTALLQGQLFEELVSNDGIISVEFSEEHPEMISTRGATKGQPKADYKKIQECFEVLKNQNTIYPLLQKDSIEQQKIITGEIFGVPFKGCIDFYDTEYDIGYDTKCMKDFKGMYDEDDRQYKHWVKAYKYDLQMAIYQALSKSPQYLVAISKESQPDVQWVEFDEDDLENMLLKLKDDIIRYQAIKDGEIEPKHCGYCNYCKSIKQVVKSSTIMEYPHAIFVDKEVQNE